MPGDAAETKGTSGTSFTDATVGRKDWLGRTRRSLGLWVLAEGEEHRSVLPTENQREVGWWWEFETQAR